MDTASTSANDGTTVIANNGALANIVAIQGFPFINIGDNNGGSSTLALDGTSGSITIAPDINLAGRNVPVQSIENIAGNNTISGSFELVVEWVNLCISIRQWDSEPDRGDTLFHAQQRAYVDVPGARQHH